MASTKVAPCHTPKCFEDPCLGFFCDVVDEDQICSAPDPHTYSPQTPSPSSSPSNPEHQDLRDLVASTQFVRSSPELSTNETEDLTNETPASPVILKPTVRRSPSPEEAIISGLLDETPDSRCTSCMGIPYVLPPKTPPSRRVTLVLDLDETLVHCFCEPTPADLEFPVMWNGARFKLYVRKRPHLDHFLDEVSELFEVVVFTASHRAYADKLLDILDPDGRLFHHRLFRNACTCVDGAFVKDLSVLGREMDSICIIDNSPEAYRLQEENGIPISTWIGDDPADRDLLQLLPFLRKLSESPQDVRLHIHSQFSVNNRS